jgi:large repetitive protein
LPAGNITVEAWVNPRTLSAWVGIATFLQDNGLDEHGWALGTDGSSKISFGLRSVNDSVMTYLTATHSLPTNQWSHVAGVYDGVTMQIFVNGVLDNTSTAESGNIDYIDSWLSIGAYKDDNEQGVLNGLIDEVRLWNVARTATQIRDEMTRPLVGNESGLVAYYRFDQSNTAGQTTLYDLTGNALNGTLTNMDATTDWVASSAFNTWIGGDSTNWATAANWSRNAAPVSSDNVGVYSYTGGNNAALNTTTTVRNLVVATGATLSLGSSANLSVLTMDFVNGSVSRSSGAVTQETRAIAATGAATFGLAGITTTVTTLGDLSQLVVTRTESDSTHKTGASSASGVGWGKSWTIAPTGCGSSNCTFDLTLPHSITPDIDAKVCKYTAGGGFGWDCARTSSTAATVTRTGLTSFSEWAVGNNVGPTTVTLRDLTATANTSPGIIGAVGAAFASLAALGALLIGRRVKTKAQP